MHSNTNAIKPGMIMLWKGFAGTIPVGWALCDGNNGTPDLRDNFVVGAGNVYVAGNSGGTSVHNHTFTTDGHFHTFIAGSGLAQGMDVTAATTANYDTGFTEGANHLPPYYALCYIMKL